MNKKSVNPFSCPSPLIAHRGASALAPENTLAAFRKAHAIGAKWVEFDVMLAACGEAVVMHDETLDRTTNGSGRVIDYPYSILKTFDAGSWFDPVFSSEKIPTLAEVLMLLCELNLGANIEIKPAEGIEEDTVKKVLSVLDQHWCGNNQPLLISSFSRTVLETVRQYSATHHLGFLMHDWEPDWQTFCDALNCVAVDISHPVLSAERVREVKATHRLLLSYTVDDPVIARRLFDWGVDAVFSNCSPGMAVFL
ncbi:MAG TPA: glycerophosphoryl diester phosphodiesterase [Gammaproteobacteria bacterium]|nr:glycerophosphoryl diester phosphodiesterase [Gammaproteobacteria bacterium]